MLTIRLAELSDVRQINLLSAHLGYESSSDSAARDRLVKLLNSDRDYVYVAEENGHLVAWVHYFEALRLASDSFFEIGGLVVNPSSQRQNIGTTLVRHILKMEPGSWRVRCHCNRENANRFYEKVGFVKTKTQYVYDYKNGSCKALID